ncbi:MAG: RagB/SusD family nutrient uptake outer membrane protein [Bacteroidales bacterium]|nr:RagB/SusD family nutrient uptake outer membrane protein [Candidatus Cacconaster merdequi]
MKKYIAILASALLILSSCDKQFEEVPMTGSLTGTAAASMVEQDPSFLTSYVNGLYSYMVKYNTQSSSSIVHDDFGYLSLGLLGDVMCQDVICNGTNNWYVYDINHDYGMYTWARPFQFWNFCYTLIAKSNEIIDFFGEEDPENQDLRGYLGQAYAMRVLAYTTVITYFQDVAAGNYPNATFNSSAKGVPLIFATRDGRTTDEVDQYSGRNTLDDVCKFIEENIDKSLALLNGYTRASKNEINYSVAQGLAARYYLLTQQWSKAAEAAAEAKSGFTLMDNDRLHAGFMEIEDPEVMWGFNHSTETMTSYASFFSMMSNDCTGYGGLGQDSRCIDRRLYEKMASSDYRKSLFNTPAGDPTAATAGAKFPYASRKFGYVAQWLQDYTFMRAAEMYLIESEAKFKGGDATGAKSVLQQLMDKRDPEWVCNSLTFDEIYTQRRIELWGEGFNYFDVRRLAVDVIRKYDGTNFPASALHDFPAHDASWNFQIPNRELQNNPAITEEDQNEWDTGEDN